MAPGAHELPLLVTIAAALSAALVGGYLARKLRLPTLVGYLLAGMAIGPFTPGFVGDAGTIGELAELGVIFLMFGVGLHFSLKDLWRVRRVAVPGALGQIALATLLGYALARFWGWSAEASLVLGLAISIASTVVLLRGLADNGWLDTQHGRVAVGWLILEDIATVLLLLILPALASDGPELDRWALALTLLEAGVFIAVMLFFGARIMPRILLHVARTRSRELFVLVALTVALGTALASSALFGVSLALGAFLAGVVVNESPLSHQVGADTLSFREAFSALFFVSVGMLVDPKYLWAHAGSVLALTALIVFGKATLAVLLGAVLSQPIRTGLVVAAGLSQIGEFSFIIGQAGVRAGMLRGDQYSLILAAALLSITINPAMFGLVGPIERLMHRSRRLSRWLDRARPSEREAPAPAAGCVVVVGCGRVGRHIVEVLGSLNAPRLVVESDAAKVEELRARGVPTLYGDAANTDILNHARLSTARVLVVTVDNEATAALVVAGARQLAPTLPIVARASTQAGTKVLAELGAQDVIHPELEGGLEVVRHTLGRLGFPLREIRLYAEVVRRDSYDVDINSAEEHRALRRLLDAARSPAAPSE